MPDAPTLMVHFARSGGSPESVAALEFGGQRIKRCAHLIVTCNAEGELCRRAAGLPGAHTLLLPPASNDQGFAMTSSFTGMLLAAGLALRVMPAEATRVTRLAELGRRIMSEFLPLLSELAHAGFERVVYLGSGELKGLAHEAALKMLELTDGQVVSTGDSPLAFRHGPKAILNAATLAVVFLSNDAYTRRYELDLVAELRRERIAGRVIALADRADVPGHRDTLVLGETHTAPADALTDLGLCLPYVMFAQALALLRSLSLGLSPDNPNATGTVHRVVKGVSIYPYGGER